MKFRRLLQRLRLRPLQGAGERLESVDALATGAAAQHAGVTHNTPPGGLAPVNWVPTQQDSGRPRR